MQAEPRTILFVLMEAGLLRALQEFFRRLNQMTFSDMEYIGRKRVTQKVHSGVDCGSGYVHTVIGTAANVHDIAETSKLLGEDDEVCYGDSGYIGVEKRPEIRDDEHLSKVKFRICRKLSRLNVSKDYQGIDWEQEIEHRKASIRCKVEHPFLIVKRQFGYCKTAYRGIAKNMNRFYMLFGCANLVMCVRGGRAKEFCSACIG